MPLDLKALVPDAYAAQLALDAAAVAAVGDPALVELLRLRVSQLNGCAFCLDLHARGAVLAGVPRRKLDVLAGWAESALFTEREHTALALAEASCRPGHPAPGPAELAAARACFDEREVAALLFTVTVAGTWNRLALAAGLAFPVDDAAADRLAARLGVG